MIILLYGEDEFRSSRKLAEIKNKFLEKNKEGGSLFVFDFSEAGNDIEEIALDFSSGGLFSGKKLIILKNLLADKKNADSKRLVDYVKNDKKNDPKNVILVFWEGGNLDKKNKLFALLKKESRREEFKNLDNARLKKWIREEVEKESERKATISDEAVNNLSIFVGNNLFLLHSELEKLIAYKEKGEISSKDVNLLVRSKIDTNIFNTIDSLSRGDKKTAVRLLHDHLDAGEDPFYLLSMYFFQFRNLLKTKPLAEKSMSWSEIAAKLKIHPFVAKKSIEQGRNFSLGRLKNLYRNLCEIDFETKTGKIEIGLALDKFIASV